MRIAMIVHNEVRKDARVIKEANTIRSLGHDVVVYGLTGIESGEHFTFGPYDIPVNLIYRPPFKLDKNLFHEIFEKTKNNKPFDFDKYFSKTTANREEKIVQSFSFQGLLLANAVFGDTPPDVIHIHDHVALTAASIYRDYLDVGIVWDAHEIYQDLAGTDPERGNANASIINKNAPLIDKFITINDSIAKFYHEHYPDLPSATILPNAAVKSENITYDGRLHDAAGLDKSQKILLFQGGISHHRGAKELVIAAENFPDDWSLVFMGWGNLKEELEIIALGYAFTNTFNERVCFIEGAPQEELAQWTAGATLGAIPYENISLNHLYCTPNKLWEYPLSGVPILASDLEEMGKSIRQHGIGVLIKRDFDHVDITNAINNISDESLITMREACANYAKENNWQVFSKNLEDVYLKLENNRN